MLTLSWESVQHTKSAPPIHFSLHVFFLQRYICSLPGVFSAEFYRPWFWSLHCCLSRQHCLIHRSTSLSCSIKSYSIPIFDFKIHQIYYLSELKFSVKPLTVLLPLSTKKWPDNKINFWFFSTKKRSFAENSPMLQSLMLTTRMARRIQWLDNWILFSIHVPLYLDVLVF